MISGSAEDRAIEQYYKDLESGKIDWESYWHTRYMECKKERDDALMKAFQLQIRVKELEHENMLYRKIAPIMEKDLIIAYEKSKRECGNG